jgi:hypothetical protein
MVIWHGGVCAVQYRILVLTRQCSPSGRINPAQHSAGEQPVLEDVAAEQ